MALTIGLLVDKGFAVGTLGAVCAENPVLGAPGRLVPSDARKNWQRGRARRQMQKLPATARAENSESVILVMKAAKNRP